LIVLLLPATVLFGEPIWAYGFFSQPSANDHPVETTPSPAKETARERVRPRHVPGSSAAYSLAQIATVGFIADWFPAEHPPLTRLMMHGPAALQDKVVGCALCHFPNGLGKPENAPVAGLPEAYIVRQLMDMKQGLRHSSDRRKKNAVAMVGYAVAMSDAEIREAAQYFSVLPRRPWIRVVEAETVPQCDTEFGMFYPSESGGTEALGQRLLEVPEDWPLTQLRDSHSGFVAYVPRGTLARGASIVQTGGVLHVPDGPDKPLSLVCASCHGPALTGVADIPPLAGRSPSYLARQLYDFQTGARRGSMSAPMQAVVANLTEADILAIVAYIGSLDPTGAGSVATRAGQN
jgi:cytochrome c553